MGDSMAQNHQQAGASTFFEEQKAIRELNDIQKLRASIISLNKLSQKTISDFEHIMLFAALLDGGSELTDKIISCIDIIDHKNHSHSNFIDVTDKVMNDINIAFAVLQFLIPPAQYLWAWSKGESVENQFELNTKWALATVLLTLSIVAAVLTTLALPLGLAAAFISLGSAVVSLANSHHQKLIINENIEEVDKVLEPKIESIKLKINQLNQKLEKISHFSEENEVEELKDLIKSAHEDIAGLMTEIEDCKPLMEQKIKLKSDLDEYGVMDNIDQAVKISLSAMAITGIVVTLVAAPPVGALIIGAAVGIGFVYSLFRILPKIANWISQKLSKSSEIDKQESLDSTDELSSKLGHEMKPLSDFLQQSYKTKYPVVKEESLEEESLDESLNSSNDEVQNEKPTP